MPLRQVHFNHNNRQDVREGGEIPPLPRNCERNCHSARCNGREQEFSPGFSVLCGGADYSRIRVDVSRRTSVKGRFPQENNPLHNLRMDTVARILL